MLDISFWILTLFLCTSVNGPDADPSCEVLLSIRDYKGIPLDEDTCQRQKVRMEDIETNQPAFAGDTPEQGFGWLMATCQGFQPGSDSVAEGGSAEDVPAG